MAISLVRFGLRTAFNLERSVLVSSTSAHNQLKLILAINQPEMLYLHDLRVQYNNVFRVLLGLPWRCSASGMFAEARVDGFAVIMRKRCHSVMSRVRGSPEQNLERVVRSLMGFTFLQKSFHTQPTCNGSVCYIPDKHREDQLLIERTSSAIRRYSKHHGRPEDMRKLESDSDSGSDSDTACKGFDRSDFWRRKMRTVHSILDVNKDGLISFSDFQLFAERFRSLGHLDQQQAREFSHIIQLTWEEQWGAVDPYNFVTVEQYLEDMHRVLNDKTLKKKAHRWLPYLFKAVDKDKSGFISVKEFKLFFQCLGLDNDHAAVAFAAIDTNGDGKLSLKEFVKLGKDFFFTEDESKVSKMFWGPLNGD